MSIINNTLLLAAEEEGGYRIDRSLRFRSSASAYLNRTPGTASNRQIFTFSGWVKRGALGLTQRIMDVNNATADPRGNIGFTSSDTFEVIFNSTGSSFDVVLTTSQVFRDPSAWYHIIVSIDTTQATASNRVKVYVNGAQITSFGTATYPSQNTSLPFNNTFAHNIGRATNGSAYLDGYLTEINFVDGQALTPSSFGEYNEDTGVWQPKKYAGTYGTNGFYLNFKDNASTTTLGDDLSGNGNDWTTNNFSLTAGATYDSMIDTPTPYADGGNGRGNFCVLNPLDKGANSVVASGNLDISSNNGTRQGIKGTFGVSTGKWYFEFTKNSAASASVGVASAATAFAADSNVGSSATSWGYLTTGDKLNNNSSSAYGATWTTNDVIGVAFDMDAGTITFYKNNSSQGQAFSGLSGTVFPMGYNGSATVDNFNFGQQPFAYTPPTGFKALNTQNLPESTIVDGSQYFDATLYTGTGGALTVTNGSFQPDFVWVKNRTEAHNNVLQDAVRGYGSGKNLSSNRDEAEGVDNDGIIASVTSTGFTVNVGSGAGSGTSKTGNAYVGWQWKANGAGVSNTAGSITSTVSANTTAGFSVVTFTGTTSNQSVGHGLGVTPKVFIVKSRSTGDWWYYTTQIDGSLDFLSLNTTNAAGNASQSSSTSTVFFQNQTDASVAYCFAPVAGYSAFGSYTGNGSADGPFVFCGFRPRWVMIKRTSASDKWTIRDTARATTNTTKLTLNANDSQAEYTPASEDYDIVSNGFKLRTSDGAFNASGGTYIYMAFAESPFRNSLAR
jgi:hypothetical protein